MSSGQLFLTLANGADFECKYSFDDLGFLMVKDVDCNLGDIFENKLSDHDTLMKLSFLLNSSEGFHYEGDDLSIHYYPNSFTLSVDSENFDEPEMILTLRCHSIKARYIECAAGWNGGEPINDPCDEDGHQYLLNKGGISDTLLVLLNNDFEETNG